MIRWRFVAAVAVALLTLPSPGIAGAADALLWFDAGRATPQAQQAVALLADARSHGLDPADYDAPSLGHAVEHAGRGALDAAAAAALDRRLTLALERYLGDLHSGRIAATQLPHGYAARKRGEYDAAAALRAAVAGQRLAEAARDAAPRFAQYERLRAALAEYRALGVHPAWKAPLPPLPASVPGNAPKLEPGQPYAGVVTLRERLIALGDLPSTTPDAAGVYDEALAAGVRAFQRRHGLTEDGVVGRATLAQLAVPPAARARQIELTLERLRWTPLAAGRRMVVINVPEFVLRAYAVHDDGVRIDATMKIIVGKALNTRTPLFVEEMRSIEFQPFWNVPPSIARGEVVPRLRRDPAYWEREGFEFVLPDGRIETGVAPGRLDDVVAGRARIRQRPGPRNALGDIKFVFPNQDNIYLHHTPAVQLFARDRRDFSHGCIRVEQPVALARFVLQELPGWDEGRIRQAMREDDPRTVRLPAPVPVVIAYATAMVRDGRVHFYEDLYGHDRALDAALRAPRPPLPID
jgi:murein L,D-transpeptidase YcbB/YkuD